jgi:hypothetical protein
MAVALDGTGGFFTRLGALIEGVNEACTAVGATLTSRFSDIAAQYASNEQSIFAPMWDARDVTRSALSAWVATQIDLANRTLIEQVDRDTTLSPRTEVAALRELIRQMKAGSDSLNRPSIAASATADGGNVGNTVLVTSTVDGDGLPLDCTLAETLIASVTNDAGNGATEFSESIQVLGDTTKLETDYDWPGGSGANVIVATTDPAVDGLLQNGAFEDWTITNIPDSWTIAIGAATTHVTRQASPARSGDAYNLRLTSDGTTLVALRQAPTSTLLPLTVYAATITAKINTTDATGALRFALVDSTGTVINDAEGTANASTLGVNGSAGVDTSYKKFTVFFRTPAKVPATVLFELKLTTAPSSGRLVDIDLVQMVRATQLYPGGPYAAAFAHTTSPIVGDRWTIAATNSLGTGSLVRGADRLLSTRSRGLKFPTDGSPTVADSLVA